jgi:hypothetical protein
MSVDTISRSAVLFTNQNSVSRLGREYFEFLREGERLRIIGISLENLSQELLIAPLAPVLLP